MECSENRPSPFPEVNVRPLPLAQSRRAVPHSAAAASFPGFFRNLALEFRLRIPTCPQVENTRSYDLIRPPVLKHGAPCMWAPGSSHEKKQRTPPSMCLHESLNSSPRRTTGLCCLPGLYVHRVEGKGCSEPLGPAGPLINSHVLQAREWPMESLLCNRSSAGRCAVPSSPPNTAACPNRAASVQTSRGGSQQRCCGQGPLQDFLCCHAPWPGLWDSGVSLALVPLSLNIFCRTWKGFTMLLLGSLCSP